MDASGSKKLRVTGDEKASSKSKQATSENESTIVRRRLTQVVADSKNLPQGIKFTTQMDLNRGESSNALKRSKVYRE